MRSKHKLITQQQIWLLRAAIGDEQTARHAWTHWEKSIGPWSESHIDLGSFRLLPSVYKNLKGQNIETASLARLKGIYKLASIKNMRLFHNLKQGLQVLHDENIPILVFKGGNLVLNYYRDRGARPMSDVDVLVPQEQALSALKALMGKGWSGIHEKSPMDVFEHKKSVDLIHTSGAMLDLHRSFLFENSLSTDERIWQRALASSFYGFPILVPSVEDEFLTACIHGGRWNPVPSIRWIADANILLQCSETSFDWVYFVEEAKRRKVSYRVWKALHLLDEVGLGISQDVLNKIGKGPFENYEAVEEARISKAFGIFPRSSLIVGYAYIREYGYPRGIRAWLALAGYVLQERNAPTGWPLFFWLIEKFWNSIKRRLLGFTSSDTI